MVYFFISILLCHLLTNSLLIILKPNLCWLLAIGRQYYIKSCWRVSVCVRVWDTLTCKLNLEKGQLWQITNFCCGLSILSTRFLLFLIGSRSFSCQVWQVVSSHCWSSLWVFLVGFYLFFFVFVFSSIPLFLLFPPICDYCFIPSCFTSLSICNIIFSFLLVPTNDYIKLQVFSCIAP